MFKRMILGLLAVTAVGAAVAAYLVWSEPNTQKAARLVATAESFRAEGKTAEATVTCRRAVALDPTCKEHRLTLAGLYVDAGQLDAAASELRLAVQIDPAYDAARLRLAEIERRRGDLTAARVHARVLGNRYPLDALLLLARTGVGDALLVDAERWYRRALWAPPVTLDPRGPRVVRSEAALEWARVLERFPRSRVTETARARELCRQEGLASGTDDGSVLAATALVENDNLDSAREAVTLLEAVIERRPGDLSALTVLARARRLLGDAAGEEAALIRAASTGNEGAVRAAQRALAGRRADLALSLVQDVDVPAAHRVVLEALVAAGRAGDAHEFARRVAGRGKGVEPLVICGMALRDAGNLGKAEEVLQEAVAAAPGRIAVKTMLAGLRVKITERTHAVEDFLRAEGDLQNLLAVAPSEPTYHWAMGDLYLAMNQPQFAVQSYVRAAYYDPDFVGRAAERIRREGLAQALTAVSGEESRTARLLAANIDRANGRTDSALAQIQGQDSVQSIKLAAELLATSGRREQAVVALTRLGARADVQARTYLAGLYLDQGEPREARKALDSILPQERTAEVYLTQARVAAETGGDPEPIVAESAVLFGDDPRTAYRYAQIRYSAGDPEAALRILSLAPYNLMVAGAEGEIYAAEGNMDRAADCYLEVLRANPDSVVAYTKLASLGVEPGTSWVDRAVRDAPWAVETVRGLLAQTQGDPDTAERHYQQALQHGAGTVVLNNLAWIHLDRDDIDVAETYARQAHERSPASPSVADTLGWVTYRKGDLAGAVKLLEQAVAGGVADPTLCYHLARVYRELGRGGDEIRGLYDRAITARSDFPQRDAFLVLLQE